MRIVKTCSHLNGLDHMLIHKAELWSEIQQVLDQANQVQSPVESGLDDVALAKQLTASFKQRDWHWRENGLFSLVKDRIALGFQTGEYSFAKHVALYVQDEIDVGIEILPMTSFQEAATEVTGNGRGVPAVPLVMIGVAP